MWTAGGKIAAIGVKISRGIAFHGFALDVNTDLSCYRHIIPLRHNRRPVTSMAAELGEDADRRRCATAWCTASAARWD